MSSSVFQQLFEDFQGLDLLSTDLSRPDNAAKVFKNCSFLNSRTIGKRPGCLGVGAPGRFVAIAPYVYRDLVSGVDVEEIVAVSSTGLYRLATTTLSFTGTGTLFFDWASDGDARFSLYNGSTLMASTTFNPLSEAGLDTSARGSYGTIYDLCAWLVAQGLTVTWPNKGGRTTASSGVTTVTVDANSRLGVDSFFCYLRGDGFQERARGYQVGTTFTAEDNLNMSSGLPLGSWQSCVTSFTSLGESDQIVSGASFWYWEPILEHYREDDVTASFFGSSFSLFPDARNTVSFANLKDSLFMAANFYGEEADKEQRGDYNYLGSPASEGRGKCLKFDGKNIYRLGAPIPDVSVTDGGTGGAIPAGTYQYYITTWMRDFNGYETWGNIDTHSFTNTGGDPVNISAAMVAGDNGFSGTCGLIEVGANSDTQVIELSYAGNPTGQKFQVGDWFCYTEGKENSEVMWARVEEVDHTPVATFSGTGYTVVLDRTVNLSWASPGSDVATVTNGAYFVVYRTVASGITGYRIGSYPLPKDQTVLFVDDLADPTANEVLLEPDKGKTWNDGDIARGGSYHGSINCTYVSEHQGALVLSGDPLSPNALVSSEPGDIEYFPLAFNVAEIPANTGGSLTGLVSQGDDIALVFKQTAIYELAGDLANQAYSIRPLTIGDYGAWDQGSVLRFGRILLSANQAGLYGIAPGEEPAEGFAKPVSPLIGGRAWDYQMTRSCNDVENKLLLFTFIPEIRATQSGGALLPLVLVYDYEKRAWANYEYLIGSKNCAPSGGFIMASRQRWQLSLYSAASTFYASGFQSGTLFRTVPETFASSKTGVNLCFYDDGQAIAQEYRTNWMTLGEPGLAKLAIRVVPYSVQDEGDDILPDTLTLFTRKAQTNVIRFYKDWDQSTLKATYTWSVAADARFNLDPFKGYKDKFRAMQLSFSNSTKGQSMQLSGFEIAWKPVEKKDDPNG